MRKTSHPGELIAPVLHHQKPSTFFLTLILYTHASVCSNNFRFTQCVTVGHTIIIADIPDRDRRSNCAR